MKKLISSLLVMTLAVQLSIPTLALGESNTDLLYLQYDGHGQYTKLNNPRKITIMNQNMVQNIEEATIGDVISAKETKDEGILYLSGNKYLTQAEDDTYMLVDRLDVDVDNFDENYQNFESYDIPEKYIQEMKDVMEEQKARGNTELEIEVYTPSKLDSSRADELRTASADEIKTYFYTHRCPTHNDIPMRNTQYIYRNAHSKMIEKRGSSTKSSMDSWVNLGLSVGGLLSTELSVFGAGKSLLDFFVSRHGPVTSVSNTDYTTSLIVMDFIKKDEEAQIYGRWMPGCVSNKVWLNRIDTYNFFHCNGNSYLDQVSINQVMFSPNWDNPHQSLTGIMSVDPQMETKLYDTKVILCPI